MTADVQDGLFEAAEQPTHSRPLPISLYLPPEGERTARPSILSPIPEGTDIAEAELGSTWLKLGLFAQGLEVAAVLNARDDCGHPLYPTAAVEIARRSAKTTSILAVLLGRCLNRAGYKVINTAQDGLRARNKLREVMRALKHGHFEAKGLGKLFWSNGLERIDFANGSSWIALPPDPSAFRSDAADAVLIDEAGELSPEKADGLLAGVLPLMDTRPDGQVIIAGTPNPEQRAGLLWATLEDLRAGVPGVGGVVYEATDFESFADLSDPDNPVYDLELLARVHPGISCGLTTAAKVLSRIGPMGLAKWCAEYLCQWPRNAGASALDGDAWDDCESDEGLPVRPERVGLAWDVDPDGSAAALVAAWRDDAGRAHFEVLACRPGTDWLPRIAREADTKHRSGGLGHDPIGQNLELSETMTRAPYRVRQRPLTMKHMIGAAARIEKEIRRRNVRHYGQPDLTDAVKGACWRPVGVDGRLFARKASSTSVACLVAATEALWLYDTTTPQETGRRVRSSVQLEARRRQKAAA